MSGKENSIICHIDYSMENDYPKEKVIKMQDFIFCIDSIYQGIRETYKNVDKVTKYEYEPVIVDFQSGSCIMKIVGKCLEHIKLEQLVKNIGNVLKLKFDDILHLDINGNNIIIDRSYNDTKNNIVVNVNFNIKIDCNE